MGRVVSGKGPVQTRGHSALDERGGVRDPRGFPNACPMKSVQSEKSAVKIFVA